MRALKETRAQHFGWKRTYVKILFRHEFQSRKVMLNVRLLTFFNNILKKM